MNYTVKKIGAQDFDLLIPLMRDAFGMDVNVAYFRWKFLDNPAGMFVGFIALSEEQECAAYYGVIPEQYTFQGKNRLIYQSCDTMTHSRHRRKGLFQLLAEHCYNYLRENDQLFVIGFGGTLSTPGLFKFGWKEVFKMHYLFRLGLQATAAFYLNKLLPANGYTYKKSHDPAEIMELRKKAPLAPIGQKFTSDFLKWRLANPRIQYTVEIIYKKKVKAGYFIYYLENDKVFLFDYYLLAEREMKGLTQRVDEICHQQKCKGIVTIGQENTPFASLLTSNGFFINNFGKGPLAEKIPFMIYAMPEELTAFNDNRFWEVTPIYHDAL